MELMARASVKLDVNLEDLESVALADRSLRLEDRAIKELASKLQQLCTEELAARLPS